MSCWLSRARGALQVANFRNTVQNFKQLIGLQYADQVAQTLLARTHFRAREMPDGTIGVILNFDGEDRLFSMVQIVAMMLVQMKKIAEAGIKGGVRDITLSVPVYYNDAQRLALLSACRIADLNCLQLVNNTTAGERCLASCPCTASRPRMMIQCF